MIDPDINLCEKVVQLHVVHPHLVRLKPLPILPIPSLLIVSPAPVPTLAITTLVGVSPLLLSLVVLLLLSLLLVVLGGLGLHVSPGLGLLHVRSARGRLLTVPGGVSGRGRLVNCNLIPGPELVDRVRKDSRKTRGILKGHKAKVPVPSRHVVLGNEDLLDGAKLRKVGAHFLLRALRRQLPNEHPDVGRGQGLGVALLSPPVLRVHGHGGRGGAIPAQAAAIPAPAAVPSPSVPTAAPVGLPGRTASWLPVLCSIDGHGVAVDVVARRLQSLISTGAEGEGQERDASVRTCR